VRERRYARARVIEVAPIREVAANVNATDIQAGRTATVPHKRSGKTSERAKASRVRTKTVKREQEGQVRKERKDRGKQDRSEDSNERKKGKKCEENTRTVYVVQIERRKKGSSAEAYES